MNIVGAKPWRKWASGPDMVPTESSPSVQVNDPPENIDFSPALERVCLLKVGCAFNKAGQNKSTKAGIVIFITYFTLIIYTTS